MAGTVGVIHAAITAGITEATAVIAVVIMAADGTAAVGIMVVGTTATDVVPAGRVATIWEAVMTPDHMAEGRVDRMGAVITTDTLHKKRAAPVSRDRPALFEVRTA
jgi:hypothetical protein